MSLTAKERQTLRALGRMIASLPDAELVRFTGSLRRKLKRAKVKYTARTGKRLRWRKPKVQR